MILLLLLNLVVMVCAWLCVRRIFDFGQDKDKLEALVDFCIAVFLFYFAQIVLTEMLLGVAARLTVRNLALANLVLLCVAYSACRKRKLPAGVFQVGRRLQNALADKTVLLALSIILGFGAVKVAVNLFNPPFGWDSLNYHFTFPVEWLKHADLSNPITINDDFAPTYYPLNGSLYFFWLLAPLRSVFLADLGQLPFFIIAFLAVFSIGCKLRLGGRMSFYAASLFVLIPNFFKQLQIAYVDVMVAALFLACLNFLFLLAKDFVLSDLLFFALGLGLLLGTKLIALPYCLLLLVPFVYLVFKKSPKRIRALFMAAAVILLLGGFSYFRNFIETGNPFYPLEIELAGKTLFAGVIARSSYAARFNLQDYSIAKALFHEGMGGQTLLFVLPVTLLGLVLAVFKSKKRPFGFITAYFLLLPLLLYLVYRYVIPFANTRYLYPLLGTAMAAAIYTAGPVLNIPRKFIKVPVVLCLIGSAFELAKKQELIAALVLTVLLFFLLPPAIRILAAKNFIRNPMFLVLSGLALLLFLTRAETNYVKNEFSRYVKMTRYSGFWPEAAVAWEWLNNNTNACNIAYVGRPVPFPLYGSRFKNSVYYVSVNKTEPARLQDYPGSFYRWDDDHSYIHDDQSHIHKDFQAPANYRGQADYFTWLANLRKKDTDYLFVYSLHQTKNVEFSIEDVWARANPEKFAPVFSSSTIRIYKISK